MVYRDQVTGYVYLQALTTDHVDDVTYTVFDLFATFGAPAVLQSENGRGFASRMVQRLRIIWPGLQLVHGEVPPHAAHGRNPNQVVKDMLFKWLSDNKTDNWCVGLKIVQTAYNNRMHPGMQSSPYELMFGTVLRFGLVLPQLPVEVTSAFASEEDVYVALLRYLKNGGNSVPDLPTELATEMFTKGKVGDHVKVKLMTGVDKGLFNIRDTKGIILSVKGNMYEIGTDLGRLPKLCTREQFQICDQDTRSTDNSVFPLDEYCTYEVTKDYSVNTFACQCVKQCKNFRCMCKRMHIQCSSVCHNQSPCFNKTYCHSSLPPEDR
ncbi:uncharacterized protein LOC112691288 [Sipha flava]|nr:uncharacterized protein LOC112691288 [Sipha flava]